MIIKANKEENLYLLWNKYTDSPEFIGTRGELTLYLIERAREQAMNDIERSFEVANVRGSSTRGSNFGTWDDEFIHVSEGAPTDGRYGSYYIERSRLTEYARLLAKGDEASAQSILIFREDN